jgi:hypothetical protein
MAQPATESNVLNTLDDRAPTAFYWQLTLLATLGGFLFGYDTSNISLAGVLVCFAALAALAIVFVWKFLPETKGLPVEEIVKPFDRQSAATASPVIGAGPR